MQRSTVIALVGLSLAGVIAGGALGIAERNQNVLRQLTELCEVETQAFLNSTLPPGFKLDPPPAPRNKYEEALERKFPGLERAFPTCRAEILPDAGRTAGLQQKLRAAQRATFPTYKWEVLASGIAMVSIVPWAWYFLLRRLSWAWSFLLRRLGELRAAINGNPPRG